jgi:hypothetical protein
VYHTHSKNSSIISLARLCLFITQLSVREKMPSLDDRDRVVGPVLRELESGTYEKTFLVLDFGSHTLYGYAGRPGNSKELSELTPTIEINCQWITKVRIASFRPRVLHCLEIGLPTGCQFFSVDSEEERDEWVESIRRCSMGQGAGKPVATTAAPAAKKEWPTGRY